jgi:hypothetical protein
VLFLFFYSRKKDIRDLKSIRFINSLGFVVLMVVLLYMGLRPISGFYFVDMATYARTFEDYANGMAVATDKDVYFEIFTKFCSSIMTVELFFLVCAALYVIPLYYASKKIFKEYWFYAFLMLLTTLTFWAYGTNGIRNGIASSIFIFAITRNNKFIIGGLLFLATSFHGSLLLPTIAYAMTYFYKNTKYIFYFWLLTIPMSIGLGGFWESFFLNIGFADDQRIEGYFDDSQEVVETVIKVGFRWDFIIYSCTAVFSGWYFIFKKKFHDPFYNQIFNTYLIVNGIWILIIKANFSNRFAYLSWFFMGFVIIYPLLKNVFFNNQHQVVANIIIGFFLITFLLNVILAN